MVFTASSLFDTGITAHAGLTGLGNDDHTQYLTNARGDARYHVKATVDTALGLKSDATHGHSLDSLSNVAISAISLGEVLKWDGTNFINQTLTEAGIAASAHGHAWGDITGKPSTYTPSAHGHPVSEVTGLQTELNGLQAGIDSKVAFNRVIVSGAHTAAPEQIVCVDTSVAAVTVTAPAAPSANTYFYVGDAGANAATNNITIAFGAATYNGIAGETFLIDVTEFGTGFLFTGTTWRMVR